MTQTPLPARTRYAPSPTGRTHLGNLRSALFAWCYARHTGGQFLLRIEDTDRERLVEGGQAELMDSLRWLGLTWDEGPDIGGPYGPYIQSENLPRYGEVAAQLVAEGHAYYCDCTPERLEIVRKMQKSRGIVATRYDNHCRTRGLGPGAGHVVRLKMPESGTTTAHDAIRGPVTFDNAEIGDPVILKSDGFPTYHLAVVVDDHNMRVTHVLRGEEWLPSTPIHLTLYAALGWEPPTFAHLPLVTDFQGRKIKKRTDATDQPEGYQEYAEMLRIATLKAKGYLPEGVFNFLAFLGWHPGTTEEILTREEIATRFTLDRISASPGVFDVDRLNWFNHQHMKRLTLAQLTDLALPYLRAAYTNPHLSDPAWVERLITALRDDLTVAGEVVELARFAFAAPTEYGPEAAAELAKPEARIALSAAQAALPTAGEIGLGEADTLFKSLRERLKAEHKMGGKAVMMPIRVALTGDMGGPHLPDILALIGPAEAHKRIAAALHGQ